MASSRTATWSFSPRTDGRFHVKHVAVQPELPPTPGAAAAIFRSRLAMAERYVALLASTGTVRGLIGPRETSRLWDRHVLNCAVLAELIPPSSTCIDIGSGAGLPGIPLALAHPGLQVHLVEPLERRTTWLNEVVAELGLGNVTVHRGKADLFAGVLQADVVTARAVAPLARLGGWALPLLHQDGRLLALKGRSASDELAAAIPALKALGARTFEIVRCGVGVLDTPATVVSVKLAGSPASP